MVVDSGLNIQVNLTAYKPDGPHFFINRLRDYAAIQVLLAGCSPRNVQYSAA